MTSESFSIPSPNELARELPSSLLVSRSVATARAAVQDIVSGRDQRFLLVVGPCSIHDEEAALEYATRLSGLARRVSDDVFVCMRAYFEKPRTCAGWKGFVHDPRLDGSSDVELGLRRSRVLMQAIAELGLGVATELLDPLLSEYYSEFLSWGAIGARTSESQIHRELASSRSFAVGFKNGTDGGVRGAVHSVLAAARPHTRFGVDGDGRAALVRSAGNPHCHIVLRGGANGPNYEQQEVARAASLLREKGAAERIVVDCSHGNSGKESSAQCRVLSDICRQLGDPSPVVGAMLESHLVAGTQAPGPLATLRYGQSVTDACIDFDTTARLVEELCLTLRGNRSRRSRDRHTPLESRSRPEHSDPEHPRGLLRSSSATP
jgi:3-deoxy-7-phosphoheptulonate synthase